MLKIELFIQLKKVKNSLCFEALFGKLDIINATGAKFRPHEKD